MTREQIRDAFLSSLATVAPEADLASLKPDAPLRDQVEMDSFDVLNLMIRVREKLGVDVPEADYRRLATLNEAVAYLEARLGSAAGAPPPDSTPGR